MKKFLIALFFFCFFSSVNAGELNGESFKYGAGSGSTIIISEDSSNIILQHRYPVSYGDYTFDLTGISGIDFAMCGIVAGDTYFQRPNCVIRGETSPGNKVEFQINLSPSLIPQIVGVTTSFDDRIFTMDDNLSPMVLVSGSTLTYNGEYFIGSIGSRPFSLFSSTYKGYYINMYSIQTPGSALECTTESIPNLDFINIQPTNSGSIAELIEDPTEKTYAYATSLSGDNPLQVIFFGVEDVSNFVYFSIQTGALSFNTENRTFLSEKKTFLSLTSSAKIDYIKILGDYGKVDIFTYNVFGASQKLYENIDLNLYTQDKGLAVGNTEQVVIVFNNSVYNRYIDSMEIYSIGANTNKDVEICYNPADGQYSVDGEDYTGNPYTDLVGTPTPTDVTFSQEGYIFYENGFCLKEFIPVPSGGDLFFEIKTPSGEIKTTYSLKNTGIYKYGAGICSKITTNYHNVEGQYYVKGKYLYNGITYDIHPNFLAYMISSPEFIPGDEEVNPWAENSACGISENTAGFLPGVSRFFACLSQTIDNFFKNQYNAVKQIGGFIYDMTDIFTTEVKDFSFFYTTYADSPLSQTLTFEKPQSYNESPFGKMTNVLWGVIATLVIMASIWLFIYIKTE